MITQLLLYLQTLKENIYLKNLCVNLMYIKLVKLLREKNYS